VLRSSSSLTRLIAFWLASNVDTSNSGMPNSTALAAANWAAPTTLFCANQVGSGCRAAAALAMASRAEASSSAPSWTRRRARPVMPTRLAVVTAFIWILGSSWVRQCGAPSRGTAQGSRTCRDPMADDDANPSA
jgi:hypothetical protein